MKTNSAKSRQIWLDQFRGFAMIIMAIYHFCFDLNNFGVLHENINHDPFWLNFRAVIMTSFTGAMGLSLYLAQPKSLFQMKKRLGQLALCCLLISGSTYFINPETFIYFGILHFIFIASIIGFFLIRWPWLNLPLALGFILTPLFYRNLFFYQPFWILTGLSPIKPNTEDFAPFFPWMGTVCAGIFIGYLYKKYETSVSRKVTTLSSWLNSLGPLKYLEKMGHHSLIFYMTHQLVLMPLAWMISKLA